MSQSCLVESTPPEHQPNPSAREARGRQIAKQGGIRKVGTRFAVPSQSGTTSAYLVNLVDETCTCPDYELRRARCKHIEATYFSIAWASEMNPDGTVTETVTVKRKSYPRNWHAYNRAQAQEAPYVERLLRALCDGIAEPPRKPGRGRKPMPLKDQAFVAVSKVYSTKAQRYMESEFDQSVEKGFLDHRWHYNAISNFLGEETSTALLVSLVEESAKPLAMIECGQFAIDSTGFSTTTYERWFSVKHQRVASIHPWVKLHIMVGTVTHGISGVKVTSEADCPQLPSLLAQTMKSFDVREVSGDKAYSSKDNLETLESFGVEPFVPFKINAVADPKCETWSRHLAEFIFNQERFLGHYHRRSNVESVMHMIKSKFGSSVRSKIPIAQVNEVLCKCLCHNLTCLVQAIFTAGLAPKFWQDAAPKLAGRPVLRLVPQEVQ